MTGEKSSIRGLLSNHYDANVAGGHRKSLAVGSRRRIKEGHLSCYYTIVKRELIYVKEEVKTDMW